MPTINASMPIPNLLRPEQVLDTKDEIARIDGMLNDPRAAVEDRNTAVRQLNNMKKMLDDQSPTEFPSEAKDAAARRERELKNMMVTDGMPTQAEMRKAPPGAVNKLITWEQRNKGNLAEWKYLRQRLNAGSSDPDIANFERYRPEGGASELSMDNALIVGKQYHLPPAGAELPVLMSDEEKAVLEEMNPEVANMMALATNTQRREILKAVRGVMVGEAKPKKKRNLSPDERAALGARLQAGRDKKAAQREAAVADLVTAEDKIKAE